MNYAPSLLDSDTLSELSRGHNKVTKHAHAYLVEHGRLSFSAITVFERMRGYRAAIAEGKPHERYLLAFEQLCLLSCVLPVDGAVAERAAKYWGLVRGRVRHAYGDMLIAATASVHDLTLVTRNRKDFEPIAKVDAELKLRDWAR